VAGRVGREKKEEEESGKSGCPNVVVRVIVERKWSGQKKAWEGGEKSKREDHYD